LPCGSRRHCRLRAFTRSAVASAALAVAACTSGGLAPPEAERFGRTFIDTLQAGSIAAATEMLSPRLAAIPGIADSLRRVAERFPVGPRDSVALLGADAFISFTGKPTRRVLRYQVHTMGGWAAVAILVLEDPTGRHVDRINVQSIAHPFPEPPRFPAVAEQAAIAAAYGIATLVGLYALLVVVHLASARMSRWLARDTIALPRGWRVAVAIAEVGGGGYAMYQGVRLLAFVPQTSRFAAAMFVVLGLISMGAGVLLVRGTRLGLALSCAVKAVQVCCVYTDWFVVAVALGPQFTVLWTTDKHDLIVGCTATFAVLHGTDPAWSQRGFDLNLLSAGLLTAMLLPELWRRKVGASVPHGA
jgi:hypothetical protein